MRVITLYKKVIDTAKFYTLLDQIVVTAGNFMLSIVITSSCGLSAYGTFASAWLWIFFLSSIHQAIILIPMLTLYYKITSEDYLNRVAKLQALFSIASSVFVLIGSVVYSFFIYGSWGISNTAFLIAIISGFFLWNEYMRKRLFLQETPLKALLLDLFIYGSPLIVILFFNETSVQTILKTLLFFYVTGFCFNCSILFKKTKYTSISLLFLRHWKSANYLVYSSLLQWFAGNSFLVLGSSILSFSEFGAIRVAQNIIGVSTVLFQYLENTVPIELGKFTQQNGSTNLGRFCFNLALKNSALILTFLALIFILKSDLVTRLYGEENLPYTWIIDALCILQIFVFIGSYVRFYLRAIENNRIIFYGYLFATITSLSSAHFLIQSYGQLGIVLGLFIHQVSMLLPFLIIYISKSYGKH